MLEYQFYQNDEDGIALAWKPFPEGVVLLVKHKKGLVHVPLDLRALLKLQSEVDMQVAELQPTDEDTTQW